MRLAIRTVRRMSSRVTFREYYAFKRPWISTGATALSLFIAIPRWIEASEAYDPDRARVLPGVLFVFAAIMAFMALLGWISDDGRLIIDPEHRRVTRSSKQGLEAVLGFEQVQALAIVPGTLIVKYGSQGAERAAIHRVLAIPGGDELYVDRSPETALRVAQRAGELLGVQVVRGL